MYDSWKSFIAVLNNFRIVQRRTALSLSYLSIGTYLDSP